MRLTFQPCVDFIYYKIHTGTFIVKYIYMYTCVLRIRSNVRGFEPSARLVAVCINYYYITCGYLAITVSMSTNALLRKYKAFYRLLLSPIISFSLLPTISLYYKRYFSAIPRKRSRIEGGMCCSYKNNNNKTYRSQVKTCNTYYIGCIDNRRHIL